MPISSVSIIIPTYNRAGLLATTIESVLRQTFGNWECLVIDDFSTDNTEEVVQCVSRSDARIKYLLNERTKGAQGARNTGLMHAKGNYINFLDSDDIMYSHCIEKKVSYFSTHHTVDVVSSFAYVLDSDSRIINTFCPITEGNVYKKILKGSAYIDTNSAMIKTSFLKNVGLLDENCPSYQEWDLHILMAKTARYGFVPEFCTGYYQRNSDTISSDKKRDLVGRLYIMSKHRDEFIANLGVDFYRSRCLKLFQECKSLKVDPKKHMNWSELDGKILRHCNRKEFAIGIIKKFTPSLGL